MVVHAGPGHDSGTLVNALLHHLGEQLGAGLELPVLPGNGPERPGIVHRLDRDTSGLLVIAKHLAAQEALARQFRVHSIERAYRAIVADPPQNMRFPGIVDREVVAEYLQASDLFFLASFQELFPMSLLEAAKCGLPILLRDIPLYPGILFGHYYRATDVQSFSDWIRRICQDEAARRKGIEDARRLASIYSETAIYKQWKALYEELRPGRTTV